MRVLAVIVNYKTADMALGAARAVLPQLKAFPGSGVVVVDNDSRDGSCERLRAAVHAEGLGPQVEVVASGHNGGFGFGNNTAIRRALASASPPELFYLLNSDAWPDDGAVASLVDALQAHPRVGLAGSFVHGPDGVPHASCFRFPSVASELETALRLGVVTRLLGDRVVAIDVPPATGCVDWISGASMMIRREVFQTVGLFDEGFFLYYEETDLCRRALSAGWSNLFVRESSVTHLVSASTGMKDVKRRTPLYLLASRRHYFKKTHGERYLLLADVAWLLGFSTWRVRRRLQRKPDPDRPGALVDFVKYNFNPARPAGTGGPERPG